MQLIFKHQSNSLGKYACEKLEHIKLFVAYAHPLKQFVYAPCVNMANVSWHENRTCASHIMMR